MEIVPVESVVAIFEIKRTLNKKSLLGNNKEIGAIQHINNIVSKVKISKYNREQYLPGGIKLNSLKGGYMSNPLLGILGIEHPKSLRKEEEGLYLPL